MFSFLQFTSSGGFEVELCGDVPVFCAFPGMRYPANIVLRFTDVSVSHDARLSHSALHVVTHLAGVRPGIWQDVGIKSDS